MGNDKENLGDIEGRSRIANSHIVGIPRREREKKNGGKEIFEEIVTKNFPKLK